GLRGRDAKQLKIDHVKMGTDKNLKINIHREKNHAGGLKNLNNSDRVCQIPPDMDVPVSDILYYIFRRGNYFKSEEFFLKIASANGVASYHVSRLKLSNQNSLNWSIQETSNSDFAEDVPEVPLASRMTILKKIGPGIIRILKLFWPHVDDNFKKFGLDT
ncbi:10171_t:CDS:2, partial [Scutellospora calospora]